MKNRTKKIQHFLAHELLLAYKDDKVTLTLYHILVKVADRYKFDLFEIDDAKTGFNLRGCYSDRYWILLDTLSIIQKMIDEGIICYFEQGDVHRTFPKEGIGKERRGYDQSAKITGSCANHIYENLWKSIWISSDIENYAKNGFVSEELSLVRNQAKDANKTLKWAILTFVITAVATICNLILVVDTLSAGVTTFYLHAILAGLLIFALCILFILALPTIRRIICNYHRY